METQTQTAAAGRFAPVRRLTVLYDDRCRSCRRQARWLTERRFRIPVELLPATSPEARARYPHVAPWLGRELVVIDDQARAWIGPPAFVMCLWATRRYRPSAWIASHPMFARTSNAFFRHMSNRRHRVEPRTASGFEASAPQSCEWGTR